MQIDVDVKMDAANPGGAVVQLYFSQNTALAVRPRLMLLAFAKVDRANTNKVLHLSLAIV